MKTNEITNHGNGTSIETKTAAVARQTPEQWWAGLKPVERQVAQVIAGMMGEVTGTKRVEIRKEGGAIRARFIYLLRRPEKGCLSAVMLPECDRAGMN
jgi:hypothetical protein